MSSPPSSTACSLFIGGLLAWSNSDGEGREEGHEEDHVSRSSSSAASAGAGGGGGLSRSQLEATLLGLFPGSAAVHLLAGKSYAFVDFGSHDAACAVVSRHAADSAAFVLPGGAEGEGEALSVGWAQGKPQRRVAAQGREYDNSASHNADCW